MALNKIFASTQELHRERDLSTITAPAAPASIQPGVPVLFGTRGAVSLTASGNATRTQTTELPAGVNSVNFDNGGVGNTADPARASFAFDGTWEFAVTGATDSTASEVAVYITSAGVLTTSSGGGNVLFGHTDYPRDYRKEAGRAPVRIGA